MPKLLAIVGPVKAKLIGLACKKLSSEEILDWGLCEEVSLNPYKKATILAKDLLKRPKIPQQMVKESINRLVNKNEVSKKNSDVRNICELDSLLQSKTRGQIKKNKRFIRI